MKDLARFWGWGGECVERGVHRWRVSSLIWNGLELGMPFELDSELSSLLILLPNLFDCFFFFGLKANHLSLFVDDFYEYKVSGIWEAWK